MDRDDFSAGLGPEYPDNPYAAPLAEDPHGFSPTRLDGMTLNPWLSIWTKPRATIRQIVETDPKYMVVPVAALAGISGGLSNLLESATPGGQAGAPDTAFVVGLLIGAVIGGAIGGLLMWLLFSWLVKVTAGWLGGTSTLEHMRAAYAWGQSPGIWTIPVSLLLLLLVGGNLGGGIGQNPVLAGVVMVLGLIQVVIGIWSMVTLSKCVGEVNLFSAWRGFGAIILAGLLIMVPLMLILFAAFAAFAPGIGAF